jgi:hypothetical protein
LVLLWCCSLAGWLPCLSIRPIVVHRFIWSSVHCAFFSALPLPVTHGAYAETHTPGDCFDMQVLHASRFAQTIPSTVGWPWRAYLEVRAMSSPRCSLTR